MSNVTPITSTRRKGKRRPVGVVNDEFNETMADAGRNNWATQCKGRGDEFTDYEVRPTLAEAEALCHGCVLLKGGECQEFALATHASIGVYGGVPFQHGRPVRSDDEPQWEEKAAA